MAIGAGVEREVGKHLAQTLCHSAVVVRVTEPTESEVDRTIDSTVVVLRKFIWG